VRPPPSCERVRGVLYGGAPESATPEMFIWASADTEESGPPPPHVNPAAGGWRGKASSVADDLREYTIAAGDRAIRLNGPCRNLSSQEAQRLSARHFCYFYNSRISIR
jgi:hypothetical protein